MSSNASAISVRPAKVSMIVAIGCPPIASCNAARMPCHIAACGVPVHKTRPANCSLWAEVDMDQQSPAEAEESEHRRSPSGSTVYHTILGEGEEEMNRTNAALF